MNAKTGAVAGGSKLGAWQPTVLYLLGLLVAEWAVFLMLAKYL